MSEKHSIIDIAENFIKQNNGSITNIQERVIMSLVKYGGFTVKKSEHSTTPIKIYLKKSVTNGQNDVVIYVENDSKMIIYPSGVLFQDRINESELEK